MLLVVEHMTELEGGLESACYWDHGLLIRLSEHGRLACIVGNACNGAPHMYSANGCSRHASVSLH